MYILKMWRRSFCCLPLLTALVHLSAVQVWPCDREDLANFDEQVNIANGINAQKITVARITQLCMVIRDYETREGRTPDNLEALVTGETRYVVREYSLELFVDGWGRELLYHSTGSSFVLISFGEDGSPDVDGGQKAGGWSDRLDFDADIVSIGGRWAQSPEGVPR